ncbi:dual oxidase 2-like isoform X2 [Bolinopsis microptera]|uniref:dual oxidase 2-like isoform X2 n=1 Tax=Bolinopsis microptera TaxID=2820187 RepID=UPI00307A0215
MNITFLVIFLLHNTLVKGGVYPYVSYNGMYNNPSNLDWGSAGSPLSQPVRPHYSDGASSTNFPNLPSPRDLSLELFTEEVVVPLSEKYTVLLPYFMEFLDHDILELRTTCPPEDMSISIKETDPTYGNKTHKKMPIERISYDVDSGVWADFPRKQINSVSSWIDGSQVYGISKGWVDIIRSGKGGKLKGDTAGNPAKNTWGVPLSSSLKPHNCEYPDIKQLHLFGDGRSNENPGVYSLHWLFFNEHNLIAEELGNDTRYRNMNDKWLFDKSRYLTIAKLQKISVDAVISIIGPGFIPEYMGYRATANPAVSFLYAGAVKFFFLTMMSDIIYVSNPTNCTLADENVRLCNTYWDAQVAVKKHGPAAVLRGLSYQPAGNVDMHVVNDIRSNYYGPMHWTRRDGIATAIQRGRDLGVPPLNSVLNHYNEPAMTWREWGTVVNQETLTALKNLYKNDVDQVELFVGGMLLSTHSGDMANIFKKILAEQIIRLREGDRFWFENKYNGLGCTGEEVNTIRATSLRHILTRNKVDISDLTNDNVFLLNRLSDDCKLDQDSTKLSKCEGDMLLHYDYNTTPYAIPLLVPVFLIFTMVLAVVITRMVHARSRPAKEEETDPEALKLGKITELGSKEGDRSVKLRFDDIAGSLVMSSKGKKVRSIPFKKLNTIPVVSCSDNRLLLLISIPKEYDIMLKFSSVRQKEIALEELTAFSDRCNVEIDNQLLTKKQMMKVAKTEKHRQHLVDTFLSSVFSEMMQGENGVSGNGEVSANDKVERLNFKGVGSHVLECELTRTEFASALGLRPDQEFVEKVFPLVDKDKNGSISFREFLSFMIVYSSGTSDDKLKLIFNMYDYDKNGSLHVDEIKQMITSMLQMVSASIKPEELSRMIQSLLDQAGLGEKKELTFLEFQTVMSAYRKDLEKAQLEVKGGERLGKSNFKRKVFTAMRPQGREIKRYIENHRLEIFYSVIFLLVVFVLFLERFITYSRYKDHTGYPQLLGYSLSLTRGSAAVLMFTFPLFLVLMCKNTLTHLRGTFIKRYIPLDANRTAHIYLGCVTLLFILVHCIGHGYNFYMITTLSPDHLTCLMPRTWLDGQGQATVLGLLFGTITGITGILLVLTLLTMYICATQYARRYLHRWFWSTHMLYPAVLGLMVLHGAGRLLQEPTFHYYLIGPAILFTFDKLISVSRKKREIPLIEAKILPSEVTNLVFKRPVDFHYLAGQYVNIALVNSGTGRDEYHPFTLTSAPHEDYLSVHIRTLKGWTKVLRDLAIKNEKNPERNPNLFVDGPFGEAHQDYSNYEVVILVGGGIGVTPFASILKDLVHKATSMQSSLSKLKKVYFLWSTRTQKQFEWLLDIIGKCEHEDRRDILDTHIFITRFYEKSDLRTTMLYICERQFQDISNRSLFTGLKAVTHFGRPNFSSIFDHIALTHQDVRKFGVFVCGSTINVRLSYTDL